MDGDDLSHRPERWRVPAAISAAVLAAAVAGIGVWFVVAPHHPRPVPPPPKEPGQAPKNDARSGPQSVDHALMTRIRGWVQAHPGDFLGAIERYDGAARCMTDTHLVTEARKETARLEAARAEAARAALAKARADADALAADGYYDDAIARLDNIPQQSHDLIAKDTTTAQGQFRAEAVAKIQAVMDLARTLSGQGKPEDGLAALDRQRMLYTPMIPKLQALRQTLLAEVARLKRIRHEAAVAQATTELWKILDRTDAAMARNDLAAAARLADAAATDEAFKVIKTLVDRLAAVARMLPVIKAKPAGWLPANGDEAVAAAMLALAAKDANRMAAALQTAKGHPFHDRYYDRMLWLRFRLGSAVGAGTRQRSIQIQGSGQDLEDCVVRVQVPYDSDMRRDYADLRFFGDGGRPLDYWIESAEKEFATVWVRLPTVPKGGTVVALCYGDPEAKPASDGRKVFLFFDDFATALDGKAWAGAPGRASVKDGVLTVSGGNNNNLGWLDLRPLLPGRLVIEARLKVVRAPVGMHGGMALFAEDETCNHLGWDIRRGLAGIDYNYDTHNQGENNPNPKAFGLIPLQQGVKLTPFWNDAWFRQTLAYDGTAEKGNLRYVRDKAGKSETLVHTGRRTDRRVKLVIQPWSWFRARIEIDWIAVRPYVAREPVATVGDEIAVAPKAKPDPLRRGLLAFWEADGTARDSVGTHHGTAHGVTYAQDRHGKAKGAFNFDGARARSVRAPRPAGLATEDAFTLSVWVRMASHAGAGGTNPYLLNTTAEPRGQYAGGYALSCGKASGKASIRVYNTEQAVRKDWVTTPEPLPLRRWVHLAATFDRGALRLYLDGKLVASKVSDAVKSIRRRGRGRGDLFISSYDGGLRALNGAIDDVGIWDRALSSSEIKLLHIAAPTALIVRPR